MTEINFFGTRDIQKSSRRSRVKTLIYSQDNVKEEPIDSSLNIKSFDDSSKKSSRQEEMKTNDTPYEESAILSKSSKQLRSKSKNRKAKENGISKSM